MNSGIDRSHGTSPTIVVLLILICVVFASGCSSRRPATVEDRSVLKSESSVSQKRGSKLKTKRKNSRRPHSWVVRRGDTLFAIAFRFGLDHKQLAAWNRVAPPYVIYPGQRLRLNAPINPKPLAVVSSTVEHSHAAATPVVISKTPKPVSKVPTRPSKQTPRKANAGAPLVFKDDKKVAWLWPTKGKLISTFSATDSTRKGVDIDGKRGQRVVAASDGQVVYSDNGLIGYGELIIIKHSQNLISAYGHNRKRLVKEGELVKKGQKIAEMGSSGAESSRLHFEIRLNGKPVDPLRYLPKK